MKQTVRKVISVALGTLLAMGVMGCTAFSNQERKNTDSTESTGLALTSAEMVVPVLNLTLTESQQTVKPAGYHWSVPRTDGTEETEIADALHPLDCQERLSPLTTEETAVTLTFAEMPDTITVRYWPTSALGNPSLPGEETEVKDRILPLEAGAYIYQITAEWDAAERQCHGTVDYYLYLISDQTHCHMTALRPQTVAEPISGYCGNTCTTLYWDGKSVTFDGSYSVTLTDILANLDYKSEKVCRCLAEYTVDTEFGTGYQVNLSLCFARTETGQADLTDEQVRQIKEVITWAANQVEN